MQKRKAERMTEIQVETEEKKRFDKIQMAQIEAAKDQAKIQAEKEIALKELELKAQEQASTSAAADSPPHKKRCLVQQLFEPKSKNTAIAHVNL